ncbi:hypothetical protein [Geobacter sp. DSM 9736]|uniref:hypothetical protein n=1 Tax=Geobacter sp. DSM 9736 TaxID=1277350 RepID=UPI000B510BFB|nr:hypothetical protein [Geobacter sp. DSM 9736]SNB45681.1 hypothetical protein SAMN06269301_1107 [Geobacter sp. DSM 9736]
MKLFKSITTLFIAVALISVTITPCRAADSALKEMFEDGIYGALTGALLGAAALAFTHKPGKHLDYIAVGGAVGAIGGVAYGVVKSTRALAEVEDGKVKFALPTIMPDFPDDSVRGKNPVVITAELIRGKF